MCTEGELRAFDLYMGRKRPCHLGAKKGSSLILREGKGKGFLKDEFGWEREDPRQFCERGVALVNLEEGRDPLQSSGNEECARTIGSALISPSFGYLSLHVHNQTVRP
jgi:hypothetical protein